jgi:hypothetical protein
LDAGSLLALVGGREVTMRLPALSIVMTAACFSPHARSGLPCGANGACPENQTCLALTQTCELDPDPTAESGTMCVGSGLFHLCYPAALRPKGVARVTGTTTIDTDACAQVVRQLGGGDACLVAADSIIVPSGATVVGIGSRPLVLLATTTIDIEGTIDVASHRGAAVGAGADPASCTAVAPTSPGGGAGGTYGTDGGDGGIGLPDGAPGLAANTGDPVDVRGGCPGGNGASGGGPGGVGGHGGGAVYLLAGISITIDGTINASGAGGDGCSAGGGGGCGGGGGGAGGMIVLDGPTVTTRGALFANGGGGGEGASSNHGNAGAESSAPDDAARGGTGGASNGGDGGDGATATSDASDGRDGVSNTGGGGGGGGGGGVIKTFSNSP